MRERPKMRWVFFFTKFPLLSEIQTSNHHYCNGHAQKPIWKDFQVILSSSSWPKTTFVFLRNRYGYQIPITTTNPVNTAKIWEFFATATSNTALNVIWLPNKRCYGKNIILFWPGRNAQNGLILHTIEVFGCTNSSGTGFDAVHSDVYKL